MAFKQGRTLEHLRLMIQLTLAGLQAATREKVKQSLLSFTTHAAFVNTGDYAEHMKRYAMLGGSVVSGGLVLVSSMPSAGGEFRYASEKSLGYPDALFIAASATCAEEVSEGLFGVLARQFATVAAFDQIVFKQD